MPGTLQRALAICSTPQFRARAARRRMVATLFAGYAAYVALGFAIEARGPLDEHAAALAPRALYWLAFVAQSLIFGLVIALASALYYAEHNYAGRADAALDERQRLVRDRAYRLAYRAFFGLSLTLTLALLVAIAAGWHWLPGERGALITLLLGYCAAGVSLPAAIIAWTEPEANDE